MVEIYDTELNIPDVPYQRSEPSESEVDSETKTVGFDGEVYVDQFIMVNDSSMKAVWCSIASRTLRNIIQDEILIRTTTVIFVYVRSCVSLSN